MGKSVKSKNITYELNQEFWKDLYNTYWNEVIKKKEKAPLEKITTKENNFVMLKQMSEQLRANILKKLWWEHKLWFAYLWYLSVLLDTLDYNNKVSFSIFESFWVSKAMIKVVRGKFKELWFVKRFWNDFYLNPDIARKGQEIPVYILDLFKN
jgi:hypothetical protein